MDQKFVKLEEAAEALGLTTDRLNELRENGKLRAYRDGSSWKFRRDEIEEVASQGVESLFEESGISLDSLDFDIPAPIDEPIEGDEELKLKEDDLGLAEESEPALSLDDDEDELLLETDELESAEEDLDLDLATGSSAELSFDLDDVPSAESSDLDLDLAEGGDDPESILLSEAELGDSAEGPASTIIGKADLDAGSDLDLASEEPSALESDVRLADIDDLGSDAGATGELPSVTSPAVNFDDIEELELDLEAESSRILAPEDVAAAQQAAQQQQQQAVGPASDLSLDDDFELGSSSDTGLSGLSALGLDDPSGAGSQIDVGGGSFAKGDAGLTGLSALELDSDDEDDFVLGDGSDLTLSAADSGINLSPADSGLSLDDAPLELTGSAIGSGLDLGEGSSVSFLGEDIEGSGFELTPMAEDTTGEDDDSSQVIALDAFEEQQEADDMLGGGLGAAMAPSPGFGAVATVPVQEAQFNGWHIAFLSMCIVLLGLCGIMVVDLIRNLWSWDQPYQVNSTIIDSLNSLFLSLIHI